MAAEDLTFGVTVSFITGYYSAMIDGINETAEEMGIEIVLLNAENDSTKQAQQMENLRRDSSVCTEGHGCGNPSGHGRQNCGWSDTL